MNFSLTKEARYLWGVGARALTAVGGGYLLTAIASVLIAVLLPMTRVEAVIFSTMVTFAIYTCAVIWVFACRSALIALFGILAVAGLLAAVIWLYRSMQ